MKKKLLALILALAMVLSLTACGDQSADPSDNSDDSQNQEASDTLSQKVYVRRHRAVPFITRLVSPLRSSGPRKFPVQSPPPTPAPVLRKI